MDLIPNFAIIGNCGLGKVQVPSGEMKSQPGGAYSRIFNFGSPRPKEEVFNFVWPKQVDSLLYTMIGFFNHGTQGTVTGSQLSFVPLPHTHRGILEHRQDSRDLASLYTVDEGRAAPC